MDTTVSTPLTYMYIPSHGDTCTCTCTNTSTCHTLFYWTLTYLATRYIHVHTCVFILLDTIIGMYTLSLCRCVCVAILFMQHSPYDGVFMACSQGCSFLHAIPVSPLLHTIGILSLQPFLVFLFGYSFPWYNSNCSSTNAGIPY